MSKLKFQVVYSTGEDEEFPVIELNAHTPHTKGYQTPKFCEYPQEIVLRLTDGECRIKQIQILSHQSKIATKVELYVGSGEGAYEHIQFQRLGYLSLNANEESNYRARELKSVYIDNKANFLKLKLHKCHINTHNIYNQVGIIAVNVLGDVITSIPSGEPEIMTSSSISKQMTPMDDVSFDMNFDQETAKKIRQVHAAKEQAVQKEDYDQAKQLKEYEEHLKNVGIQIARLDVKKKQAVQTEDYDLAKRLKQEIDQLHQSIDNQYQQIRNGTVVVPASSMSMSMQSQSRHEQNNQNVMQPGGMPILPNSNIPSNPPAIPHSNHQQQQPQPQQIQQTPIHPREQPQQPLLNSNTIPSHLANEDRPLETSRTPPLDEGDGMYQKVNYPPIEDQQFGEDDEDQQPNPNFQDVPGAEFLSDPEPLPKALEKEVETMCQIFGEYYIKCFYSNLWNHRDAALRKISLHLDEYSAESFQIFEECCKLVQIGVSDRIAHVFLAALQLLEKLIVYARSLPSETVCNKLETTVTTLVTKLGDGQARTRDGSNSILLKMAVCGNIGAQFITSHVYKKSRKQSTAWRPLLGKLQLLQQLLGKFGPSNESGLSIHNIMTFLEESGSFGHSNGNVRDCAKEISIALYQRVGSEIEPYLKSLRPKQLEEYHTAFENAANTPMENNKMESKRMPIQINEPSPSRTQKKKPISPKKTKGSSSSSSQIPTDIGDEMDDLEESIEEFTCQFCLRRDDSFTEDVLDMHYWSECKMLTSCGQCEQVIEISCLNEHLLTECDAKSNHRECGRCGEAIHNKFYTEHSGRNDCPPRQSISQANRCPLCHEDIPPGEKGWKQHLLHDICPRNSRT